MFFEVLHMFCDKHSRYNMQYFTWLQSLQFCEFLIRCELPEKSIYWIGEWLLLLSIWLLHDVNDKKCCCFFWKYSIFKFMRSKKPFQYSILKKTLQFILQDCFSFHLVQKEWKNVFYLRHFLKFEMGKHINGFDQHINSPPLVHLFHISGKHVTQLSLSC